jgi:adhesin/invasin
VSLAPPSRTPTRSAATAGPDVQAKGWSAVPAAAAAAVSRGLGADDRSYFAARNARSEEVVLRNPAQGLRASFRGGHATVSAAHGLRLGLSGLAVGRAGALVPVPRLASGVAKRNRVTFSSENLKEWFANGPWGVEQGFTLAHRPAGGGPLLISQALSGNTNGRVAPGGQSVTFSSSAGTVRYEQLIVTDATGARVPARLTVNARRLTIAIQDARAIYPLRVDPTIQQTAELTAADGGADEFLGTSVALSGSTIVAGAPYHTVGSNGDQGAVYVYTLSGGSWTQTAELTAADGGTDDFLGYSVAVSGSTIVAGAPGHAVGPNSGQGAVYVYTLSGGSWTQTAELTAADGSAGDDLGTAVALSGSTIAAGAPYHAVGSDAGQGAAYVYTLSGGGWSQTAELTAADGSAGDDLGFAVAVSGSTLVAGAPGHAVGSNIYQGAAYVYTLSGGVWAQSAELTAADGGAFDVLGVSVALSGSTIVAGAPFHTVGSNANQGAVYVYTFSGGAWAQSAELTAADGGVADFLGYSVALSGSTLVAGAPYHTVGSNIYQGAAYVYTLSGGGWAQSTELTSADGGGRDDFGHSVALSGSTFVAGAPYHTVGSNSDQGAVYAYRGTGPAANVVVSLSPPSITADGASTSTASATVTDADGNPVLGDAVAFTSTGAQGIGAVTAGATPGTYVATITSTKTAGPATITATDSSVSPSVSGSATLTQTAGPATSLAVVLSPPSITADGMSTSTATATATDQHGNPVSGDAVSFTSTGAQHVGPVTAGITPGTYVATITSTTAAGSATITATDGSVSPSVSGSAMLTQTAGPATSVSVVLSPPSITANGASTSTATATVTDQHGNPVSGDAVAFTSTGAQGIGPVTAGATPGTYVATITSTKTAGSVAITATDSSVSPSVSGTAMLTQTAGPATSVTVVLSPPSITANGSSTSTATATVTDAFGNPVSGDAVAFASTGAQGIGPVTAGATPGTYVATITSTKTAGSAAITATDSSVSPHVSGTATLTHVAGPATKVAVVLSPASIVADGITTSTATATVTDANGNPVSSDAVTFASSGSQHVGPAMAGITPGTYVATITSTTTAGTATITATDGSVSPHVTGTAMLTQTTPTATLVTLALSPSSIIANGTSTSLATVTVKDANGYPISGQTVTITSSNGQAISLVKAGTTAGTYVATITSTTKAGTATITATDASVSPHVFATAPLTQVAGPATAASVALSPASITANGTSTTIATATVTDAHGNPVSGDAVTFASSGTQHVGAVTAGATPGTYVATITSTTKAGTATITATDTSVTPHVAAIATLTQTAGPATSVTVKLSPASLSVDGCSNATATATATVTDQYGNPVSGATVKITSSGTQKVGPVTAGTTPGTYLATITSTRTAGTATITATDSSVSPAISGTAKLTQTAGRATKIVVSATTWASAGSGKWTSTATATVTDAYGNPVSGDTVTFTTWGAQTIGPVTAGATPGTYVATITSTTNRDTTVTATDKSVFLNIFGDTTIT